MRLIVSLYLTTCLLVAAAASPVGWRTDGLGYYPDATPVTEWSADKNVVWSTPMPAPGNSTPVIVGDRIFILAEPATLVCVSATEGAILWESSVAYEDLATPEEVARMGEDQAAVNEMRRELGQLGGKLRRLRQDLQDKPDDEELKKEQEATQRAVRELREKLAPLEALWYTLPPMHPVNGYSSATPVSDGEHVWTVHGTGMVACHDMEGNRVWARVVEKPTNAWGHSASPLLVEGKLIVHILHLTALEPTSGEELWKVRLPESWGTPAVARIGETEVIITAQGHIVRAGDGKVLAEKVGSLEYAGPLVDGDVVYFVENGQNRNLGRAIRLPEAVVDEGVEVTVLWETSPRRERYYASPILHEGLLYAMCQTGHLSCIDAGSGEVVYEQDLGLGRGTCYPSVTFAGGLLFAASDNGTTAVFRPGREYEEVGRNSLEPYRGSLVFIGNRMFVRGQRNLYCVGPVD